MVVDGVDGYSERDIRNALSVFGAVSSARFLFPSSSAALVEFSEAASATKVLECANNPSEAHLVLVCGRQVFARAPTLSELQVRPFFSRLCNYVSYIAEIEIRS